VVLVEGEFGRAVLSIENLPSPDNPATSYLAALSVLTLIDDLDQPLIVGT
jgi:predicted dinucleotide-utilizing enzyme